MRLAAVLVGTAAALAVAEGALRLQLGDRFVPGVPVNRVEDAVAEFDEDLGWRVRPDLDTSVVMGGWDFRVTTNSRGLRDREHASEAAPGTFRILLLGDSFGWGWGLDDGEAFADRLEELLAPDVEIVNLSVPGYGTDQQFWVLERERERYAPDLVLLQFTANDLDGNETGSSHRLLKPYFAEGLPGRWTVRNHPVKPFTGPMPVHEPSRLERWVSRLALGKALLGTLDDARGSPAESLLLMTSADGRERAMQEKRTTNYVLGELARACREAGTPLVAFAVPPVATPEQARNAGDDDYGYPITRWLRDRATAHGFATIPIDVPLADAALRGEDLVLPDGHWTARAHAIAAQALAGRLKEWTSR